MFKTITALAPVCVLFLFTSCGSIREPITPEGVTAPRTPVVIDSKMAEWLAIPNAQETYGHTADGLLKYTFQLQNRTNKSFFFRYKTTFFDESGINVVDQQGGPRQPIAPAETVTLTVVSANPAARKVQVQVLPTR